MQNKIFKTKIYFEDKYSFKKHVLPKKKNKTVIKKKEKNVYIFSIPSCYDIGGGQRPTQLAKTFNKNDYDFS